MIPITLQLAFAGLWSYILHWGIGVALIILLCGAAYFTTAIPIIGPFLKDMRSHLLWAAFGVAIFLGGHFVGHKDASNRCEAKEVVVEKVVDRAVTKTATPKAKKQADRWDRKEF